jgi:AcrR family transcriptional regulator
MNHDTPFSNDPSGTQEKIMRATHRALKKYGYAGLSLQKIADEADLSKSSVYHFFDDKEDLLVAFLDYMLDHFRVQIEIGRSEDPDTAILEFLEVAITGSPPDGTNDFDTPEDVPLFGPIVELRAQAVSNEEYRERFSTFDDLVVEELSRTIQRGIRQGVFKDVDPERMANAILSIVMGSMFRHPTVDGYDGTPVFEEVENMLSEYLIEGP